MATLALTIRSPQRQLLHVDSVRWVQVPLADGGSIGILPGHAPLLAATVAAPLRYATDDGDHSLPLAAGILHIGRKTVTIYTAELTDDTEQPTRFVRLLQSLGDLDE